jgi:hypothetical protein
VYEIKPDKCNKKTLVDRAKCLSGFFSTLASDDTKTQFTTLISPPKAAMVAALVKV